MRKFELTIEPLEEKKTTSQGMDYFCSSWIVWRERWTVRDENGNIVDQQEVERFDSVGHMGMRDRWTVCDECGCIFHASVSVDHDLDNLICPECEKKYEPDYELVATFDSLEKAIELAERLGRDHSVMSEDGVHGVYRAVYPD